jgi:hypothetical protein
MTEEKKLHKEAELISQFMISFHDVFDYYPTVVTKNNKIYNKDDLKVLELDTLKTFFNDFLPVKHGKKLQLDSRSRYRNLVELRFIYFFIARSMGYNLTTIGKSLSLDHTTVVHGLNTFKNLYETNDPFRQKYNNIIHHIKTSNESSIVELPSTT